MKYAAYALCLLMGAGIGWGVARSLPAASDDVAEAPSDWVARVGDRYITAAMLQAEMLRRGGLQAGQYQTLEQKRALLDDVLLQHALVESARRSGVDQKPEIRRSIEQLLTTHYLRDTLRRTQSEVAIADAEVLRFYQEHAADFSVPARRRVAMLRIGVAATAEESEWEAAAARLREARAKLGGIDPAVKHFAAIAREYSDDQSSRYRGGVLGWLTDGRSDAYQYDQTMLKAAFALAEEGAVSDPVRGTDGMYLVRLVELQPEQPRALEELRAGLEQRLMQQRYAELEHEFREGMLSQLSIDVRESRLAKLVPPGPPGTDGPPQPPALPIDQESSL
jgi:peptidyl-prolyl cis-trans isomerase C